MGEPYPLRPIRGRVHLKRVQDRGSLIVHVAERYGITDRVLQVAELVAIGPGCDDREWKIDVPPRVGDLVVYLQPRIFDHFRWGSKDILVYPAEWVLGVVSDCFLADHPNEREYERQPV